MPQSDEEAARRAQTQNSRGVMGRLCTAWGPNGLMDLLHPTGWGCWVAWFAAADANDGARGTHEHTHKCTRITQPSAQPASDFVPARCLRATACVPSGILACVSSCGAAGEKKKKKNELEI